jgi:hypothetical protein
LYQHHERRRAYTPWFIEHFIATFVEGAADQDHDGRISVFEACQQAAAANRARYPDSGYLSIEHALLDDDRNDLGSRLIPFAPGSTDGILAK